MEKFIKISNWDDFFLKGFKFLDSHLLDMVEHDPGEYGNETDEWYDFTYKLAEIQGSKKFVKFKCNDIEYIFRIKNDELFLSKK